MSQLAASFKFPPSSRIKRRKDFLRIQQWGKKVHSRHFLLVVSPISARVTDVDQSRLGVTVTKKVDKRAARRNRLKRRIREVFRLSRERLQLEGDYVVIAKHDAAEVPFDKLRKEFLWLLHQSKELARERKRPRREDTPKLEAGEIIDVN